MPTLEEIKYQQDLLNIHRGNLAHYLKQASFHGQGNVPLGTLNGIDSERGEIRRIKKILRGWNQQVEDHPDDEEAAAKATDSQPPSTDRYPQPPSNTPSQQPADPAFKYDVFISYS